MWTSRPGTLQSTLNDSYICLQCRLSLKARRNGRAKPSRGLHRSSLTPFCDSPGLSTGRIRERRGTGIRVEDSQITDKSRHIPLVQRNDTQQCQPESRAWLLNKTSTTYPSRKGGWHPDHPLYQPSSVLNNRKTLDISRSHPTKPGGGVASRWHPSQTRAVHTTPRHNAGTGGLSELSSVRRDTIPVVSPKDLGKLKGIRAQLRQWQKEHGQEDQVSDPELPPDDPQLLEPANTYSRLQDEKSLAGHQNNSLEEADDLSHVSGDDEIGLNGSAEVIHTALRMGDLVELDFHMSERDSIVALFVRRFGPMCQLFSVDGRWLHIREGAIQFSASEWVQPQAIEPLLSHLPLFNDMTEARKLQEDAYMEDLSVPREVAAPLVARMVQFTNDSKETYRRNAHALDNAHNILAHESDLRYGSLVGAARTLLQIPKGEIPLPALFAVRKAIHNGGFAFDVDKRSHRSTGFLQIRSKNHVKMVSLVCNWMRAWQDDLALTSVMNERERARHKGNPEANHIYGFVEKVKLIIQESRKTRQPTDTGNVGPSSIRLPINSESDCIRITKKRLFTPEESEIIRFLESWCCSNMFWQSPRLSSLPPLLLYATGAYEGLLLNVETGFMFLQEIGAIMPFDNRVRFDSHLLLPSSQHSKPLQKLMTHLMDMKDNHDLADSMADLRHDWKDLPVYCIDDADSQEIDDGVSVEYAGIHASGKKTFWVHTHIANPTAFFSPDHALAKMARHMGETIYMPERTYAMLPRWVTRRFFSLQKNRPCLTFSTLLTEDGLPLQRKIINGFIRNVKSMTRDDVPSLASDKKIIQRPQTVELTVGGEPPEKTRPTNDTSSLNSADVENLHILSKLAQARAEHRRKAGGLFLDKPRNEINVWQSKIGSGLAWDHPFRGGSRIVEGDPVIRLRATTSRNWFDDTESSASVLVKEMMLLACETAATWSAERQIPSAYRGTRLKPDHMHPDVYFRDVLQPRTPENGVYPMHLGLTYLRYLGVSVAQPTPIYHRLLATQYYVKTTSPLRRYADMVAHWQIEAALRREAETGTSLTSDGPFPLDTTDHTPPDRSFLPFSTPMLESILIGLRPRETLISQAMSYADRFWETMVLFRKISFNDGDPLPFDTFRVTILNQPYMHPTTIGLSAHMEPLNTSVTMADPQQFGLEKAVYGDVWECRLAKVEVYRRMMSCTPIRLLERPGA